MAAGFPFRSFAYRGIEFSIIRQAVVLLPLGDGGRSNPVRAALIHKGAVNVNTMHKTLLVTLASFIGGLAAAPAVAQGYVNTTTGQGAVKSGVGCVRTLYWTPAQATMECDPDLVPKPVVRAAPPPPVVAAPAPRPAPVVVAVPVVQRST